MATRVTTVRGAANRAILAARKAGRLKPWHEPHAAVALKLAAALDKPELPPAELVKLAGELDKAMARLPLAEVAVPDGGERGDGPAAASGGAGAVGSQPVGLASGVGSGPEVGDTALPR
jgi:hypothetical protein